MYRRVYVFLEGPDDERFFNAVIRPILENRYDHVQTWQYAREPSLIIGKFLKSVKAMQADYFFLADINNSPCATAKREKLGEKHRELTNIRNTIVVIKEIESWYLAGLDDKHSSELGIKCLNDTNSVTKEQFKALMPERFDSRIDFMAEVLKDFCLDTAKQKNNSFNYFMARL